MRKEIIGNAILYQGDCLEVLSNFESKEVDAVVTDPPYGRDLASKEIGGIRNNSHWRNARSNNYKKLDWDKSPPHPRVIAQIKRIGKKLAIFGGNHFEGLAPSPCWFVWDKVTGDSNFADCELVYTNLKGSIRKIKYLWSGFKKQIPEERYHPTQKPQKVMEWVIDQCDLKPDSLIVDPFMGSGTTGCAAHNLSHRFIGVEKELDYFDIACKRIEQSQRQLSLFPS